MAAEEDTTPGQDATAPPAQEQKPEAEPPAEDTSTNTTPQSTQPEQPAPESQSTLKTFGDRLGQLAQHASEREGQMRDKIMPELSALEALAHQPDPAPPTPQKMPAPYTDQQKGGIAEAAMQLFKFAALAAVAYGVGGRGRGHGAIFMGALGAGLKSYQAGHEQARDKSLRLWEKNYEVIKDANREQQQNYREILADKHLKLQEQTTLLGAYSKFYGDERMQDAAERQDIMAIQKTIEDHERQQRDSEKQMAKDRFKWYDIMGKSQSAYDYADWIREKSDGKLDLSKARNEDEMYQMEKQFPRSQFLAEEDERKSQSTIKTDKAKHAQDAEVERDKKAGEETDRLKEFPQKQKEELDTYQKKLKIKQKVESGAAEDDGTGDGTDDGAHDLQGATDLLKSIIKPNQ